MFTNIGHKSTQSKLKLYTNLSEKDIRITVVFSKFGYYHTDLRKTDLNVYNAPFAGRLKHLNSPVNSDRWPVLFKHRHNPREVNYSLLRSV